MNKIYNYLGLAQRAGQIVSGEQAVLIGVNRRKIKLLLIAEDASKNTFNKFKSLAHNHNIKYLIYGDKASIGQAIGKSPRTVLGILDNNFANVIQTRILESVQEKIRSDADDENENL
ncbi:MAG: ribosomal L7Ae/L30e/S12e/Gadd45 family protein [Bacillota bacterium]|nr:ribosomal L7Ae/L30e/S12e/Gadd45 family protein [Bacillota bacterium]HHU61867.1 50S ribosomal protein L7ae [Natronincola sp.]